MQLRVSAKWVVLWSLWAARLARQPTAPLRVSGGRVRGSIARDGSHAAYLAIPYATVTHENRFQSPGPEPKWDGIFEAYNENVKCTQRYNTHVLGQQNCLVLNVYTPLEVTHPLPVMVFIHGGGFRDGSGSPFLYGPEYLVKHGVILVSINYRLEILGFLSLGTKDAPGNAGMKDQVAALQWVKRNIQVFGGDPDNVTIFGESAGSGSVSLHLVSPMSKGLFHKAIMQSGSAISPWALQFEPLHTAKAFVKRLGYNNAADPNEIYKILMSKSAEELMKTRVPRNEGDTVLSENIFVPCVEKKIPGVDQFLPDTPFNLFSKGLYHKVPIILGYNNEEGYLFVAKENDTTISKLDFYKALPRDLDIPNEYKSDIARKAKQLYMGEKDVSKETLVQISHFEGDSGITYPVLVNIDLLLKTNTKPVYSYRLDYDGWLNIAKFFCGYAMSRGATHADDLFYMFKPVFPTLHILEQDMVDKITRMWTNFAKFGDPTPEVSGWLPKWPATDSTDPQLLVIDKQFHRRPLWEDEALLFWNETYTKFRRKQ